MKLIQQKNFNNGIISGALFVLSGAFMSSDIVLPLLLMNYTSSKAIVGLTSALLSVGWFLPQFFVGYFAEKVPVKMKLYRAAGWIRMLAFACVPFIILYSGTNNPGRTLFIFLSVLTVYSLCNGFSGISFMDIVAKTIDPKKRSSFFGGRLFWGGILAVFGGFLVSYILNENILFPFPVNYYILFSLAFIFFAGANLYFFELKEPEGIVVKRSFKSYFNEAIRIIRSNKNFRALVITRYLCGATAIAFPFYVLYGIEFLGFSKSVIGAFILSQVLGRIISNLFWGLLGEKEGSRLVLSVYATMSLCAPIIAVFASYFEVWKQMYIFTFLLLGFAESGADIGFNNFLLDISPEKKRTSLVGLTHTIIAPVVLAPFFGGFMMDKIPGVSYKFIFVLAFCFSLAGLISTLALIKSKKSGN